MMPVRHRTFFPPSPLFCGGPECFRGTTNEPQAARLPLQRLAQWEVVSSYSSATAPDSHGISCADPRFQTRKELKRGLAAHARRCKNYLSHGDKSPTQGYDRAVGCHCFFLLRESLKDRVAFVTRRDRAGDVPKVIRRVLFNHTVENSLKLRADLSGRVQVMLMTRSEERRVGKECRSGGVTH